MGTRPLAQPCNKIGMSFFLLPEAYMGSRTPVCLTMSDKKKIGEKNMFKYTTVLPRL